MTVGRVYRIIVGSLMLACYCIMGVAQAADSAAQNKKIKVIAQDGAFTPSVIRAPAHENFVVSIFAKDKDYPFVVPHAGASMTIKKGSSVDIDIGSYGIGKHVFSCGSDCGGYIEVVLVRDEDD